MKLARNAEARIFCFPNDNEEAMKEKLLGLFPFDLEEQKIRLERSIATGFEHKKIVIYSIVLSKDRHINAFVRKFFARLDGSQKKTLVSQLDSRIDNELNFFVRLDKRKLVEDNEFSLTDSGKCFHIRIGIAAYPANRFAARKAMEKIIDGS